MKQKFKVCLNPLEIRRGWNYSPHNYAFINALQGHFLQNSGKMRLINQTFVFEARRASDPFANQAFMTYTVGLLIIRHLRMFPKMR